MRKLIGALALAAAMSISAQTSIGTYPLSTNSSVLNLPLPHTVINTNSGATAAGTIGVVTARFSSTACPGDAFKVKFFRLSGSTLTQIAERGPFPVSGELTTVTLTPPVAVAKGDYIAVTQLKDCAGPVGRSASAGDGADQYSGDFTTIDLEGGRRLGSFALALYGAENANSEVRTQVVVVAGSAAGAGGSVFKTDLFVGNLGRSRSMGRLVYHAAGTSGSASDVSFPFTLDPQRSLTLPQFVGTSLGQTGVGSIDVYTRVGYDAPKIVARIYDDNPAAGTKGFTLDALKVKDGLGAFENAILFAPLDTTRYRMNIGLRTTTAAELQFLHLDRDGNQRALVRRNYAAEYFTQSPARDFTGVDPQPGDTIVVYSTTQDAKYFAYASIIDNTSNDPSLQMATHFR